MTVDGGITDPASEHWLSLHEASEILGVAASTVRRWGDTGRVPMKKTLGGHRRFARAAVMHLAHTTEQPAPYRSPASSHAWGVDSQQMARQEWHARLAARSDSATMRGLGQRLLGLLMQYMARLEDAPRFLAEARSVGANYGIEAYDMAISLHDTVEAFLFFRSAFAQMSIPLPGVGQTTDPAEAAALRNRIDQFMNAVLLGVIAGYEHHRNNAAVATESFS